MSVIYLFGFEAFDGRGRNASWEAVQEVPDEMGGMTVVKRKLPVVWGEPFRVVRKTVTEKPAAIIVVGEAPRKAVCVETWGYNERVARPDNRGLFPQQRVMNPRTADRVSIPWNATPVVSALAGRYPMELSTDPGRFLCNELIYELYSAYADVNADAVEAEATPVCFIHVPRLGTKIAWQGGEFVADRKTLGKVLRAFVGECVTQGVE